MIKTINNSEFHSEFAQCRPDNFSYEGLNALFDYLETLEQDINEPIELDVIALCCDYAEYKDLKELQKDYSDIEDMNDLENNTVVIPIEGTDGFIIQQY